MTRSLLGVWRYGGYYVKKQSSGDSSNPTDGERTQPLEATKSTGTIDREGAVVESEDGAPSLSQMPTHEGAGPSNRIQQLMIIEQ